MLNGDSLTVTVTVTKIASEGYLLSSINQLCAIFLNNPNKSFEPRYFKKISNLNYNSVRKQLRRLQSYGIITQLTNGKYILDSPDKAKRYLDRNGDSSRSPSKTHLPHRVRNKPHFIQAKNIDMSGEPLEWLIKFNMLTTPNPDDPAQNVGLRPEQAKKFNMRISLRTGKAIIYPREKGWEKEFLDLFNWYKDIINRLGTVDPNMEIAINYEDVQKLNPNLRDVPFEAVQGIELYYDGMHIQLCRSQFQKEGELCIRTQSIDETLNLADKITYGNRDLSQAMRETRFENRIYNEIKALRDELIELPQSLSKMISISIKEAVKEGIMEGYSSLGPIKTDDKRDVNGF